MKYLLTLCLVTLAVGTASAQCPGGVCPVAKVRQVTRTKAVATPVVAVAAPATKPAPIVPPPVPAVVVKPTAQPTAIPLPMPGPGKTVAVQRERSRRVGVTFREFVTILRIRF